MAVDLGQSGDWIAAAVHLRSSSENLVIGKDVFGLGQGSG
jgi:hypothetical protein